MLQGTATRCLRDLSRETALSAPNGPRARRTAPRRRIRAIPTGSGCSWRRGTTPFDTLTGAPSSVGLRPHQGSALLRGNTPHTADRGQRVQTSPNGQSGPHRAHTRNTSQGRHSQQASACAQEGQRSSRCQNTQRSSRGGLSRHCALARSVG